MVRIEEVINSLPPEEEGWANEILMCVKKEMSADWGKISTHLFETYKTEGPRWNTYYTRVALKLEGMGLLAKVEGCFYTLTVDGDIAAAKGLNKYVQDCAVHRNASYRADKSSILANYAGVANNIAKPVGGFILGWLARMLFGG